jgi:hypothetical protein
MMQVVSDIPSQVRTFIGSNRLTAESEIADIFHAVRRIPYGSGGGRNVRDVVEQNKGSCSGKHILLRDVLRLLGHDAAVETVRGDFTSRLVGEKSMGAALRQMCEDGNVTDFHQYVVWAGPEGDVKLDATWSDGPIQHGVLGNMDWNGAGDTNLALIPEKVLARVEDVPAYKKRLLEGLHQDVQERRLTFLSLLTDWVANIGKRGDEE